MALWNNRLAKLAQLLVTAGTVPETAISTAETDTGLRLRPNGTGGVEWGPGGGLDMTVQSIIHDDLITNNSPFDGGLASDSSGTGAGLTNAAGEATHPGVTNFNTGTTTTGRASLAGGTNPVIFGAMRCRYGAIYKLVNLSDGTETYSVRSGFLDSALGDGADGVFFRYTDAVNGGRWEGVARSNSVETAIDTGEAADTNWHRFEIDVTDDGSSAEFFIDGASVGTISTNIPTAAGRETGLRPWNIIKSAGITSRTVRADAYWYIFDFATPR